MSDNINLHISEKGIIFDADDDDNSLTHTHTHSQTHTNTPAYQRVSDILSTAHTLVKRIKSAVRTDKKSSRDEQTSSQYRTREPRTVEELLVQYRHRHDNDAPQHIHSSSTQTTTHNTDQTNSRIARSGSTGRATRVKHIPHTRTGSRSPDFSLISSLTSRLTEVKKLTREQGYELSRKDNKIRNLRLRVRILERALITGAAHQSNTKNNTNGNHNNNDSTMTHHTHTHTNTNTHTTAQQQTILSVGLTALMEENVQLHTQMDRFKKHIHAMETFLEDYGLIWVGYRASDDSDDSSAGNRQIEDDNNDDTEKKKKKKKTRRSGVFWWFQLLTCVCDVLYYFIYYYLITCLLTLSLTFNICY